LVQKDVLFVFIGDGPFRQELESMCKSYQLRDNMLFTGYVKDRRLLYSWLKAAQVFTFSSLSETQGLVILEAMSAGTPVVAVNSMGVKDAVGDNIGGLASELDVTEFALKLNYLITDEALRLQKAREAVIKAENFTIEKMTQKMVAVYKSVQG
jgi:1,2-diacylglycerol 3-alpha-glucosyltransferase